MGTCPASQKLLAYMGKNLNFTRIALQPEALVNTSGRVLFSSPGVDYLMSTYDDVIQNGRRPCAVRAFN